MLYVPTTPEATTVVTVPVRRITGAYLARNRLTPRDRAAIAADVVDGRTEIVALTVRQIITLCKANKVYVSEARFPEKAKLVRRQRLAAAFNKLDFDSRVELCRAIGAENVWRALSRAIS
jgi:hypothetical protein